MPPIIVRRPLLILILLTIGGLVLYKSPFKIKNSKKFNKSQTFRSSYFPQDLFHSRYITFKTQPQIDIHLRRQGSKSSFKMMANIMTQDPIESIKASWFLISPQNEKKRLNTQRSEEINSYHRKFISDLIEIENIDENFKIVLLVNGHTSRSPFNRSSIFNTSFQGKIEREKANLILRAYNYETTR